MPIWPRRRCWWVSTLTPVIALKTQAVLPPTTLPGTFWPANLRLAELVQNDVLAALNSRDWAVPDDGVTAHLGLGGPALNYADAEYGHLLPLGRRARLVYDAEHHAGGADRATFVMHFRGLNRLQPRPKTVAGGSPLLSSSTSASVTLLPPPRG